VVANGAWGAGDTPLNMSPIYHFFYDSPFPGDGNNAWYEWGGTSRSTPEAAGVTALIYQAYKQANGVFPDHETARQILMSGADDLNHDVLMQGAGRVNADRATDVAGSLSGVHVSPSLLAAGEYDGAHYESFANVLYPGDTWGQTFTVYNAGAAEATVTVGDEVLMQMDDMLTYTVVVSPWTGSEDDWYPDNYYYYADYFVGADPMTTTHGSDLAIPVPAGADLMQVQLLVPFEIFDFAYDDPNAWSVSYDRDQRWSLTVYDWEDRDGDGELWEDNSGDGIVNPQDWGDEIDIALTGPTTRTEINRFAYGYLYGNEQEVTVQLGDRPDVNDIVIGIVHRMPNDTRWLYTDGITDTVKTMEFYQKNPFQVKVVFYEKADWDLVDESVASLTVPVGGSATFDATFTMPEDQPPGLYEGAITVDDGSHTSIIPTTVNVAVPDDELLFTLGGTDPAGTPYDNGRGYGAWTWDNTMEEGDWRFFYYDADAGFEQQYLYVRNTWGDLCENMPTAFETLVWGPNPSDQFSMLEPDKFGPYGMQFAGGTWDAYGPQSDWYSSRVGDWWWPISSALPLPETRVWASLWDGLNQVQFRQILASGKEVCGEGFEATAGVFGVDVPTEGISINTTDLSGSFTLDAVSPVDGLIAYASGFGQEEWFHNQAVPQGKHGEEWPEDLMDGWVYTFEVTNTNGIVVETFGPRSSDIDLYLLYDANGDGVFNLDPWDNREKVACSCAGGSEEDIWYFGDFNIGYRAQDGAYAVVMYGYDVAPGDQFDLHLTLHSGDDLSVEGSGPDNNYVLSVTPGDPETLTVNWQVPGSGIWFGDLWLAVPWEEELWNEYMGPGFFVSVTINANAVHADATKTVDREMVCVGQGGDHEILTYRITLVNDGNEDFDFEMADLLPEGAIYYPQYVNEPDWYTGSYVARWWDDTGNHGYFLPDGDCIRWDGSVGPGSGKVYIEYKVKVEAGFVGDVVNKADITVSYYPYYDFFSRTATTKVRYCLFLPTFLVNYP